MNYVVPIGHGVHIQVEREDGKSTQTRLVIEYPSDALDVIYASEFLAAAGWLAKGGLLPEGDTQITVEELITGAVCEASKRGFAEGSRQAQRIDKQVLKEYAFRARQQFDSKRAELRAEVIGRDGEQCRLCASTENLTIDHVVPLAQGGENTVDNLQILCRDCNSRKGDRPHLQVI